MTQTIEIIDGPNVQPEYTDTWETVMSYKIEIGEVTESVWVVCGIPDYLQGSAQAANSGRIPMHGTFPGMESVRPFDGGSWDSWCGFERPEDHEEMCQLRQSILDAVKESAYAAHAASEPEPAETEEETEEED